MKFSDKVTQEQRERFEASAEDHKLEGIGFFHALLFVVLTIVSLLFVPLLILPISLPLLWLCGHFTKPGRRK